MDLAHFSPWPKTTQSPAVVFLFVARLLSEKGIREFAAAARMLKNEGQNAEFRVLGSPDAGNPTSIKAIEITNWVQEGLFHYYGFVDDVRPAMAESDVIVLPSYYREGVPRSVLEGMAMAKMIITTDNVGCRDTVEDGKNGFIVPPRDIEALAAAMKKVLKLSENDINRMGTYSRQKVENEFADQYVLPQYMALVQEFLP